jgi:hypothetical protein
MTEIEMSDLSGHRESDESPANAQDTPDPVSAFWAWSTAALFVSPNLSSKRVDSSCHPTPG